MSNGKLKAQYNRVRTSVALNANSMWTKTIGIEQDPQAGSNAAVEASLRAPTHGGGAGARVARREAAQEMIKAAGVQQTVTSFDGLVALAKKQTGTGGSRGACKICGGLGHLTKQCRNFLVTGSHSGPNLPNHLDPASISLGAAALGLIAPDDDDLSSSDLDSSSSDDNSSSDSGKERKRKRKHKKSKKSSKEAKKSSKESKSRKKHKSHKEHKEHKEHKKRSKHRED